MFITSYIYYIYIYIYIYIYNFIILILVDGHVVTLTQKNFFFQKIYSNDFF